MLPAIQVIGLNQRSKCHVTCRNMLLITCFNPRIEICKFRWRWMGPVSGGSRISQKGVANTREEGRQPIIWLKTTWKLKKLDREGASPLGFTNVLSCLADQDFDSFLNGRRNLIIPSWTTGGQCTEVVQEKNSSVSIIASGPESPR